MQHQHTKSIPLQACVESTPEAEPSQSHVLGRRSIGISQRDIRKPYDLESGPEADVRTPLLKGAASRFGNGRASSSVRCLLFASRVVRFTSFFRAARRQMLSQDRHRSNPSDPTDPLHLKLECVDLVVSDIVNSKGVSGLRGVARCSIKRYSLNSLIFPASFWNRPAQKPNFASIFDIVDIQPPSFLFSKTNSISLNTATVSFPSLCYHPRIYTLAQHYPSQQPQGLKNPVENAAVVWGRSRMPTFPPPPPSLISHKHENPIPSIGRPAEPNRQSQFVQELLRAG